MKLHGRAKPVHVESVHICSFSSGLDEMPRKQQGNLLAVLTVLAERKRFSTFEATANSTIAATMDTLGNEGYFKHAGGSYPWIDIEITEKGRQYLQTGGTSAVKTYNDPAAPETIDPGTEGEETEESPAENEDEPGN